MSKPSYPALRAALAVVITATLLIACDKQSLSPTDSTSSARTSADSTTTDSTASCRDSTHHHRQYRDSTGHWHFADSSRVRHPMDSARHDSTHHWHPADSSWIRHPMDSVRHDSTHHLITDEARPLFPIAFQYPYLSAACRWMDTDNFRLAQHGMNAIR